MSKNFVRCSDCLSAAVHCSAFGSFCQYNTIQYNTITLFKEGSAITYYSFLTYGPQTDCQQILGYRHSFDL